LLRALLLGLTMAAMSGIATYPSPAVAQRAVEHYNDIVAGQP
jgi:hypothetical protein